MKSGRFSFNRAIARDAVRRCWPIWGIYCIYLIISFPLVLIEEAHSLPNTNPEDQLFRMAQTIYHNGIVQAVIGSVAAILVVMILFGFLFNSRRNTLMNSLPIRRESLFLTMFLTGLAPILLCQVLITGLSMLLTVSRGIAASCFLKWFGCAALGYIAFYGFAVFCAMLTGNIVSLPIVFFVLNFAVFGYETCIRECFRNLVYGMDSGSGNLTVLSPIIWIDKTMKVIGNNYTGAELEGSGILPIYALAGLAFAVLAMLLYRKRRMETVSDYIAIPVLKPVFRYCMGFGGAFLLAAFLFSNFFQNTVYGAKAAWVMAVLMIAGAFLGWLAAEMIIRRSVHILPLHWKGLGIVCAACLLFVLIAEKDLTGYERRVPDPEQVSRVEFCYDTVFTEPENIKAVTELHREMIGKKAIYDKRKTDVILYTNEHSFGDGTQPVGTEKIIQLYVPVGYVMKNGDVLRREYSIRFESSEANDPDSTVGHIIRILNTEEGIRNRMTPNMPMEKTYINYAAITVETGEGIVRSLSLSQEEMTELWHTAMLPDAEEGHLGIFLISDTEDNLKSQTNLTIEVFLYDRSGTHDPSNWYQTYRVYTFSEHCLGWIEAHTDLMWETLDTVRQSGTE